MFCRDFCSVSIAAVGGVKMFQSQDHDHYNMEVEIKTKIFKYEVFNKAANQPYVYTTRLVVWDIATGFKTSSL